MHSSAAHRRFWESLVGIVEIGDRNQWGDIKFVTGQTHISHTCAFICDGHNVICLKKNGVKKESFSHSIKMTKITHYMCFTHEQTEFPWMIRIRKPIKTTIKQWKTFTSIQLSPWKNPDSIFIGLSPHPSDVRCHCLRRLIVPDYSCVLPAYLCSVHPFLSNSRCGPTYPGLRSPVSSATCCSDGSGSWRNSSWRKSATWRRRRACCPTPQLLTGWRRRVRSTPSWRGSASWRKVLEQTVINTSPTLHRHNHDEIVYGNRYSTLVDRRMVHDATNASSLVFPMTH